MMSHPVTGWRFSIDGEHSDTTSRMAHAARLPVPLRGQTYVFEQVEYRVAGSEINYAGSDPPTSIAAVHLKTITAG